MGSQPIHHQKNRLRRRRTLSQKKLAGTKVRLTMRLSDVRRRKPKLIYLDHSTLPSLTEAATRCSNRLLGGRRMISTLLERLPEN